MDVHHLKVFAAVFKHKSFSRAAEELRLTQPTVSDHIRALEEELDCRLFDRLSRRIIPTKEAVLLIGRAQEVIEKIEGIRDLLGEVRKDLSGQLIIGASTIPASYILPEFTALYRGKHPGVLFEVVVSDSRGIVEQVANHELLLGLVGAKLDSGQVRFSPFLDDELVAVAAPSLIKKRGVALRELAEFPMVVREQGSGTRREFEKILIKEGIDPQRLSIVGIFGSTDAVKQAVKEGMGISIISRRSVKDELKCGLLREIKIKDADMSRRFYIITHRKRTLPLLYKTFVEFLLKQ